MKAYSLYLISLFLFFNILFNPDILFALERVYSLHKGYSVLMPKNWKNLNNKDVFQISSKDDKIVLSGQLFQMHGDSFKTFCKLRYGAVDNKLWKENSNLNLFKIKYNIKTKLYDGVDNETRELYYIVNCIHYDSNYYLSLTFVVDKNAYKDKLKEMQDIVSSLEFHVYR